MFGLGALVFEIVEALVDQLEKGLAADLQVVRLHRRVDIRGHQALADLLLEGGVVGFKGSSRFARDGLDDTLRFELGVCFGHGVAIEPELLGQRADGRKRFTPAWSAPEAAAALTWSASWRYGGLPDLKLT